MAPWAHITDGHVDTLMGTDAAPDESWITAPEGTTVGDSYADGDFAHVNSPVISATAFMGRFTSPELDALASSPGTLLLLITGAAAGQIDLSDSQVIAGVNGLTGAGILAAGRAATILTP